jgi:hypothetical protein
MGHILDILKAMQPTNADIVDVEAELTRLHKQATDKPKDMDVCLIQAFLLARDHQHEIPEWTLARLTDIFREYYDTKTHSRYETHKHKKAMQDCTIADCFNINARIFQTIRSKRRKDVFIDKMCHYKWLFGLSNKETLLALAKSGYTIETKEQDPERVFERYIPAGYYEDFVNVIENHEYRDLFVQTAKQGLKEKETAYIRQKQKTQHVKQAPILLI